MAFLISEFFSCSVCVLFTHAFPRSLTHAYSLYSFVKGSWPVSWKQRYLDSQSYHSLNFPWYIIYTPLTLLFQPLSSFFLPSSSLWWHVRANGNQMWPVAMEEAVREREKTFMGLYDTSLTGCRRCGGDKEFVVSQVQTVTVLIFRC